MINTIKLFLISFRIFYVLIFSSSFFLIKIFAGRYVMWMWCTAIPIIRPNNIQYTAPYSYAINVHITQLLNSWNKTGVIYGSESGDWIFPFFTISFISETFRIRWRICYWLSSVITSIHQLGHISPLQALATESLRGRETDLCNSIIIHICTTRCTMTICWAIN